ARESRARLLDQYGMLLEECPHRLAAQRLDDLDFFALRLGREMRISHHVIERFLQRCESLRRQVGRSHDRAADQQLRPARVAEDHLIWRRGRTWRLRRRCATSAKTISLLSA